MKPRAVGYRLVVELDPVEEVTKGGIIITPKVKENDEITCTTGTVIEVGEFAYREYPAQWVKPGERVIFAEHSGRLWKDEETGKNYRLITDLEVLGRV